HAEPFQVIKSADNAWQIAGAVAVAVHERSRINLVDDAALPPHYEALLGQSGLRGRTKVSFRPRVRPYTNVLDVACHSGRCRDLIFYPKCTRTRVAIMCYVAGGPSGTEMAEPKCSRCNGVVTSDDALAFDGNKIVHLDCQRPRKLSHEERVLLFRYCF